VGCGLGQPFGGQANRHSRRMPIPATAGSTARERWSQPAARQALRTASRSIAAGVVSEPSRNNGDKRQYRTRGDHRDDARCGTFFRLSDRLCAAPGYQADSSYGCHGDLCGAPPSTWWIAPVVKPLSIRCTTVEATSSGRPTRPTSRDRACCSKADALSSPRAARSYAVARPMPEVPPITSTVCGVLMPVESLGFGPVGRSVSPGSTGKRRSQESWPRGSRPAFRSPRLQLPASGVGPPLPVPYGRRVACP
jgi:hypothetical protein